jgi:hypothetical protein
MKVYRIRDSNGLYSTGGTSPSFTSAGKTWSNIGHVKNHLRQFSGRNLEVYADAEIVCVEYTEKDIESFDILDFFLELNKQDQEDYDKSTYKSEYRQQRLTDMREIIVTLKANKDND